MTLTDGFYSDTCPESQGTMGPGLGLPDLLAKRLSAGNFIDLPMRVINADCTANVI